MSDKVKHEIFMMYDLAGDKDLIYYEAIQRIIDYIADLEQENERLKTKTKEQSLLLIDYQDMEQKLEDYKSRIEKAVEYIKEHSSNGEHFMEWFECTELLNILNGRSDE